MFELSTWVDIGSGLMALVVIAAILLLFFSVIDDAR